MTVPSVRQVASKLPLIGAYPDDSTVSGWWILFEKWKGNRDIDVGCVLDDGSYVSGRLASFNTSADDSPARDLLLWAPILYRPPGAHEHIVHETARAASISASRIVSLFVSYRDQPAVTPSPSEMPPVAVRLPEAVRLPAEEGAADPKAVAQRLHAERPSDPLPHPGQPSCESAEPR